MNIGLLYLGIILLLGGCFLYVRYNLKNINLRITTLMELTTALTNELELIQKNMGLTNNSSNNVIDSINNVVNYDNRELVSDDEDDEDDEDDDDDEDDEDDDEDNKELEIQEFIVEDSKNDIDNESDKIEILELDPKAIDYDKLTVPELKKMVKDKNPEISITKLKKDELISLLNN